MERLQKRIAECGVASRRKAEELITSGKVTVNGVLVTELGTKVSKSDVVCVNGKTLQNPDKYYYVINKPRGVICTVNDPYNRKTIIDILPPKVKEERLFPVGRLDYDTSGVLLLTNDGEFMNQMVGPKSGIEKEYLARVKGILSLKEIKMLSTGVMINNKKTLPALVYLESVSKEHDSCLIRITVTEGNYHQIKEMVKAVGFEVKKLTRVRFGHITVDNLEIGELKRLSIHDVKILYELSKRNKNMNNNSKDTRNNNK